MSKFSSHCRISGTVRSIVWRATSLPSTLSTPVPPRADAAQIVKCERADSQPVVFEVELQRVLAWHQCLRSLPAHAFQVDEVPQKHRLALEHIEPVTAEAAALGHDHAFGAALRDVDLGLEGVGRVE